MAEAWPTANSFPQRPQPDGFEWPGRASTRFFAVDKGPPEVWRTALSAPRTFKASYLLTHQNCLDWEAYWHDDIEDGSITVDWPDPTVLNLATTIEVLITSWTITTRGGDFWQLELEAVEINA